LNTGPVVNDVFIAAGLPVLVQLFGLLTLVVKVLDYKQGQHTEIVSSVHHSHLSMI